jgi:hypothetical protein
MHAAAVHRPGRRPVPGAFHDAGEQWESHLTKGARSLEVRWIFPGRMKTAVAAWFGRLPAEMESREDNYLLDPRWRGLSPPGGCLAAGAGHCAEGAHPRGGMAHPGLRGWSGCWRAGWLRTGSGQVGLRLPECWRPTCWHSCSCASWPVTPGSACSAGAASRTGAGHGRRWGHSGPGSVSELLIHDRGTSAPAGPSDSEPPTGPAQLCPV